MNSRVNFWILEDLVRTSLINFSKGNTTHREGDLLTQAYLLGNIDTSELEKNQYEENHGVCAIWYFVNNILTSKNSNVTFDEDGNTPFHTAIKHLDVAIKSRIGSNIIEIQSFKRDLEKLKAETVIHAIGAFIRNKAQSKSIYNQFRSCLSKFEQENMECVLLNLQDHKKVFSSFSDFVNLIETTVQKMLKILDKTFLDKIINGCCERLVKEAEDDDSMADNLDSNGESAETENDSDEKVKPNENSRVNYIHDRIESNSSCSNTSPKKTMETLPSPIPLTSRPISSRPIPLTSRHLKDISFQSNSPMPKKKYNFKKPPLKNQFIKPSPSYHRKTRTQSLASTSVASYCSRQKRPFTPLQDAYIIMGMQKFGMDKREWKKMLDYYPFPEYRTGMHLKDRWRTLLSKKDVVIEGNEIKLCQKYSALLQYLAPRFSSNGPNRVDNMRDSFLDDSSSTVSDPKSSKLDYLSPEVMSDIEVDISRKVPGFNNVEKWIKTGKTVLNKLTKIPPLLPNVKKQTLVNTNTNEAIADDTSKKIELVKNSSGKYFRKKSIEKRSETEMKSPSSKNETGSREGNNGVLLNDKVEPSTKNTKKPNGIHNVFKSMKHVNDTEKENWNSIKVQKDTATNKYPAISKKHAPPSDKPLACLSNSIISGNEKENLSSTKLRDDNAMDSHIAISKKHQPPSDQPVAHLSDSIFSGKEKENLSSTRLREDIVISKKHATHSDKPLSCSSDSNILESNLTEQSRAPVDKITEEENNTGKSTGIQPQTCENFPSADPAISAEDSNTLASSKIDSQVSSHTSTSTFLDHNFHESKDSRDNTTTVKDVAQDSEVLSATHREDSEEENNRTDEGEEDLIIDESSNDTDPLQLHLSLTSSQGLSQTKSDVIIPLNSSESCSDDVVEVTLVEEKYEKERNDTDQFLLEKMITPAPTRSLRSIRSEALSPVSSEYFTADEDAVSTSSATSTVVEKFDKTIVNDTSIRDSQVPNNIEQWIHENPDEESQSSPNSLQKSILNQDTIELLDGLTNSEISNNENSQNSIKVENSTECVQGMFGDHPQTDVQLVSETLSLLDSITNASSQEFRNNDQDDIETNSQPNKRIKREFIALRTRNGIKKEIAFQFEDVFLQPPPNEIAIRNMNSTVVNKTPILKLNKIKIEPGVYNTDVCMLVDSSDVINSSLTHDGDDCEVVNNIETDQRNCISAETNLSGGNKTKTLPPKLVGTKTNAHSSKVTQPGTDDVPSNSECNSNQTMKIRKFVTVKLPTRKRKVVLQDHGVAVQLSKEDEALFGASTTTTKSSGAFTAIGKTKQSRRKAWTQEEDNVLLKGVKLFGEGNWKDIHDKYLFHNRTTINLKDRYRILKEN